MGRSAIGRQAECAHRVGLAAAARAQVGCRAIGLGRAPGQGHVGGRRLAPGLQLFAVCAVAVARRRCAAASVIDSAVAIPDAGRRCRTERRRRRVVERRRVRRLLPAPRCPHEQGGHPSARAVARVRRPGHADPGHARGRPGADPSDPGRAGSAARVHDERREVAPPARFAQLGLHERAADRHLGAFRVRRARAAVQHAAWRLPVLRLVDRPVVGRHVGRAAGLPVRLVSLRRGARAGHRAIGAQPADRVVAQRSRCPPQRPAQGRGGVGAGPGDERRRGRCVPGGAPRRAAGQHGELRGERGAGLRSDAKLRFALQAWAGLQRTSRHRRSACGGLCAQSRSALQQARGQDHPARLLRGWRHRAGSREQRGARADANRVRRRPDHRAARVARRSRPMHHGEAAQPPAAGRAGGRRARPTRREGRVLQLPADDRRRLQPEPVPDVAQRGPVGAARRAEPGAGRRQQRRLEQRRAAGRKHARRRAQAGQSGRNLQPGAKRTRRGIQRTLHSHLRVVGDRPATNGQR